jgi:hypothetical protein
MPPNTNPALRASQVDSLAGGEAGNLCHPVRVTDAQQGPIGKAEAVEAIRDSRVRCAVLVREHDRDGRRAR